MMIKLSCSKHVLYILKGYNSMIYVGIDITKQKHFDVAMSTDGKALICNFTFKSSN
jgi:hypothetical protein